MRTAEHKLKFPKWDELEVLRINFDADAGGYRDWPADQIRKLGIPFDQITIEDVEKATLSDEDRQRLGWDWKYLRHAKIVILQNKAGVERELRNRHKDGTLSEKKEPVLPAVHEPGIGYYYTTLAAHPGKVFRIRCEEVGAKTTRWKRIQSWLTNLIK